MSEKVTLLFVTSIRSKIPARLQTNKAKGRQQSPRTLHSCTAAVDSPLMKESVSLPVTASSKSEVGDEAFVRSCAMSGTIVSRFSQTDNHGQRFCEKSPPA